MPNKIISSVTENYLFYKLLCIFLYSSKASMFQNIPRIHDDLPAIDFPTVSKQAVSKARQFISPDLFKELYYLSFDSFYSQIKNRKLWNCYHLYAIDGSKFELPNSKSNFEFFGEMFGYPDPSRRFTMGLASVVYDVLDDYIIHASFHHYLASERSAAIEHLKSLETLNIYENSVVIFDRGYYSEKLFRYCVEHGHTCLMRLKGNYNISKKCSGDIITVLPGDEKKAQRILKYVLLKSSLIMELRNILQQICLTRQLPSQCFKNYIFIASL